MLTGRSTCMIQNRPPGLFSAATASVPVGLLESALAHRLEPALDAERKVTIPTHSGDLKSIEPQSGILKGSPKPERGRRGTSASVASKARSHSPEKTPQVMKRVPEEPTAGLCCEAIAQAQGQCPNNIWQHQLQREQGEVSIDSTISSSTPCNPQSLPLFRRRSSSLSISASPEDLCHTIPKHRVPIQSPLAQSHDLIPPPFSRPQQCSSLISEPLASPWMLYGQMQERPATDDTLLHRWPQQDVPLPSVPAARSSLFAPTCTPPIYSADSDKKFGVNHVSNGLDGIMYREESEDEAMSLVSATDSEDERRRAKGCHCDSTSQSARESQQVDLARPSQDRSHPSDCSHVHDASKHNASCEDLSTEIDDLDLLKEDTPQTTIFGYPARVVQQWAEAKANEQGVSLPSCTSTSVDPLDCLS